MPSRCGGDTYKLRAYVGPETLEFPTNADFSGGDRSGPVVETGTLAVWRNIRLYRWLRMQAYAAAGLALGDETPQALEGSAAAHNAELLRPHRELLQRTLATAWLGF